MAATMAARTRKQRIRDLHHLVNAVPAAADSDEGLTDPPDIRGDDE